MDKEEKLLDGLQAPPDKKPIGRKFIIINYDTLTGKSEPITNLEDNG